MTSTTKSTAFTPDLLTALHGHSDRVLAHLNRVENLEGALRLYGRAVQRHTGAMKEKAVARQMRALSDLLAAWSALDDLLGGMPAPR